MGFGPIPGRVCGLGSGQVWVLGLGQVWVLGQVLQIRVWLASGQVVLY